MPMDVMAESENIVYDNGYILVCAQLRFLPEIQRFEQTLKLYIQFDYTIFLLVQ